MTTGITPDGKNDTIYAGTSTGYFSPKAGLVYTPEMNGLFIRDCPRFCVNVNTLR